MLYKIFGQFLQEVSVINITYNNNEINLLTNKMKYFKILSEGCHIHSTYRDRRKSTEGFKECVVV